MAGTGDTTYETLLLERPRDGVALVTLNRPEKLNALTFLAFEEIARLRQQIAADHSIRAVVLTGAGRGFCAGLDLDDARELPGYPVDVASAHQERRAWMIAGMRKLPQPLVAAVNGPAAGGGLALALAADIRLAAPEARFLAPFAQLRLSGADLGISWMLPRVVGLGHASEMMLTARSVDAEEAVRIGLANRLVPAAELLDEALALAERIAAGSPYAMRLTKETLNANVDATSLEAAVALENHTQTLATRGPGVTDAIAGRPTS